MKKLSLMVLMLTCLACFAEAGQIVYWDARRTVSEYPNSIILGDNANVPKINLYIDPITGRELKTSGGQLSTEDAAIDWKLLFSYKEGLVIVTACPTNPRPGPRFQIWTEQISFDTGRWTWYLKRYQYTTNLVGAWAENKEYNSVRPIYWVYYYFRLLDKSDGPRFSLVKPYRLDYDSACDVNRDGVIDGRDAEIIRASMGQKAKEGDIRDINNNYVVDEEDLGTVNRLQGARPDIAPASIALPLPPDSYVQSPVQGPNAFGVSFDLSNGKLTTTWGKVKK